MVCATAAAITLIFVHTLRAFLHFPKVYMLCKSAGAAVFSLLQKYLFPIIVLFKKVFY